MSVAVYLGNDRIQVISGRRRGKKIKVKAAHSRPLPEGIIINGIITDMDALRHELEQLRKGKLLPGRKIDLVIDSSTILTKTTSVPIMNEKKLRSLVVGEFAETLHSKTKMIYDYAVLTAKNKNGSGGEVLCCATEHSLVESYIDSFLSINRNICSIRLGLECTINVCNCLPELGNEPFIVMEKDGNTVVSNLFANGSFLFSQRHRLLEVQDTQEYYDELSERVSHMRQFNKAQNTGAELAKIYLCGFGKEADALSAILAKSVAIDVAPLDSKNVSVSKKVTDFRLSDYCYTIGCLFT